MFQKSKTPLEELQKKQKTNELENILKAPVQERTRFVTLYAKTGCGCGGSTTKVRREVPYDSPLRNGDDIGWDVLDTDEVL